MNKGQKDGFRGERVVVLPPMIVEAEKSDPLVKSLYVTDIGFYPHAKNHYRKRTEGIGEYILIYCVEGNGWYRVNNKIFRVEKDNFFILPAGKPHAYGAGDIEETENGRLVRKAGEWSIYWIHFSGEHARMYVDGDYSPHQIAAAVNSRISERNSLFDEMLQVLHEGYELSHLRYVSSLLHYYLASMHYLREFRAAQREKVTIDPLLAAIHYMKENVGTRLQLEQITKYVGYGVSQFSALFKKETGYSPLSYFNLLKIRYACQLLTETDMTVTDIALRLGIEDNYYFSRIFSKTMGISPTKYRKFYQMPENQGDAPLSI